jgi:hypothetical protein
MVCAEGVFVPEQAFSHFLANIALQPDDDTAMKRRVGLSARTQVGAEAECLDTVLFEWDFGGDKERRIDVFGNSVSAL